MAVVAGGIWKVRPVYKGVVLIHHESWLKIGMIVVLLPHGLGHISSILTGAAMASLKPWAQVQR
jgi:hypothetical protein